MHSFPVKIRMENTASYKPYASFSIALLQYLGAALCRRPSLKWKVCSVADACSCGWHLLHFFDNGDSRRFSSTFGECNHRRKWTHTCDFGKVCVIMQRTVNSLHLYSELLIADLKVVTHSFCFCLCSLDGLKLRNVFVVASRVLYAIYRRGWVYMFGAYGAWQLWVQ